MSFASRRPPGARAYAIRALPDLCLGVVSERLETHSSRLSPLGYSKPRHVRGFFHSCRQLLANAAIAASRVAA
jgi:hypothetical protein